MQEHSDKADETELNGLFPEFPEDEESSLPDPAALFEQMKQAEESGSPLPDPAALFEDLSKKAESSRKSELPNPAELFEQMRANDEGEEEDSGGETLLDSAELFRKLRGVSLDEEEKEPEKPKLPNPAELFRQMQSEEPTESEATELLQSGKEKDKLPDPGELFRQLQLEQGGEAEAGEELPDPKELFRQMESPPDSGPPSIGSFRQLQIGAEDENANEAEAARSLPALPDLEAFKAELEAEKAAQLDDDLLGDLAGPERFANTVSDQAFLRGVSFAEIPDVPEEPASLPKPKLSKDVDDWPEAEPPTPEPQPKPQVKPPTQPKREAPSPEAPKKSGTVKVPQPSAAPRTPHKPKKTAPPARAKRQGTGGGLKFHPTQKKKTSSESVSSAQTRIQPKQEGGATLSAGKVFSLFKRTKKISRHALSIFTRQLAAMLKAGIPLHLAISFCSESDPEVAPILDDVVAKIEGGYSFSAAIKDYPDSFDPVFVGLVNAGELSGRLNEMLNRLADVLEREIELRKRLISVITYPAVLLGVSLLGTIGFIIFILPTLTPLFMDLDVSLPMPTRILLGFRTIMVPLFVLLAVGGVALFFMQDSIKAYIRANPAVELRLASMVFTVPVIGAVYEKIITARILYALATMLDVGVTMAQALSRAEVTCGNAFIANRLARAREDLCDGNSVSDCFRINDVFPTTALHLIAAGEESAQLTKMFGYVANHFDEDVENALDAAASLLEPLIMVFMGGIVGFIVIAAALPTIKLLQAF